jgi:AbrB family looped-hinge helix DNA binding protein
METVIDQFGRIVIPKQIRDDLNVGPGSVLEIREETDQIILKPARGEQSIMVSDGVLVYTGVAATMLTDAIQKDREERTRRLGFKKSKGR